MYHLSKVAILIDGGFFITRFRSINKQDPKIGDIEPFIQATLNQVQKLTGPNITDTLYRTYFYHCPPYGGQHTDPNGKITDFSKSAVFRASSGFLKDLKTHPQLALRLCELSFDGWKVDPKNTSNYLPDFKQKSVDMKIGLDIAWMASKRLVDKLVIVTGDSDFIAPMKLARKEGILVYLHVMNQRRIKPALIEHADFVIN
jgi:uncharacterized LabA/DUF88 family protein